MSRARILASSAVLVAAGVATLLLLSRTPGPDPRANEAPGVSPLVPLEPPLASTPGAAAPVAPAPPAAPTAGVRWLRGEVLAEDGVPAAGADVRVFPLARALGPDDAGDPVLRAVTDAAGRCTFDGLAAGSYGVDARRAGAGTAALPFVRVAAVGETSVTLRLAKGHAITGRVVDAEGRPIAGARVATDATAPLRRLYRDLYGEALRPTIDVVARSGSDGTFTLAPLAAASYDVVVDAAGFRRATVRDVGAPSEAVVVRLAPGVTVRGVVTVASPTPPATVRVSTEPGTAGASPAVVDGAAAFVLDGLSPGEVRVVASAPGCTRAVARLVLVAGVVPDPVRLALVAGTPVTGSVRAQADGAPIADAEVALAFVVRESHGMSFATETTIRTDGRGAWSARLRPGEWVARATKPGWSPPETDDDPPPVVVGDDPATIDLALVPAPVIEGVVVFADGAPVAGASVQITSMGTNPAATTSGPVGVGSDDAATTDAEGRFRLAAVTYGRYTLSATGPGGATASVGDVVFEAGATVARTRITLQRVETTGARVEGRVVDETGAGVAGAIALLAGRAAVTAADGTFARDAVPAGTYRARYGALGYALGFSAPFVVGPRDRVVLPPWTLARHGAIVRGTVRTTGARPVVDAEVIVWFPLDDDHLLMSATTGADGRYAVAGPAVDAGELTVQVRASGLQFGESKHTLPLDGPVDFALAGFASASATVTFAGPPTHVDADRADGGEAAPAWPVNARWDAVTSSLRVTDIVPGPLRLRITADGYAPIVTERLDAREGETLALGALRMTAGGTVVGRVRDAAGAPVAGVQVSIDAPFLYVDTDAEGRFRLEHVPPGRWSVAVNVPAPDGAPAAPRPTFEVTVVEGNVVEVDHRLAR